MGKNYSGWDVPDDPRRVGDEDYEPYSIRECDPDAEYDKWVDAEIRREQETNKRGRG